MWEDFCCHCGNEIDLDIVFLHEADGKVYTCESCGTVQVGYYDEDIDTGDGLVRMVELEETDGD